MSDPLRTDPTRPGGAPAEGDKNARIEQLLLSGLDHYFAGEYEQAINVWTRVVFLERGHDRARAYIDRARSAQAERHRESEELLHRGVAAFDRGETEAARDLFEQAVERGGPHDVALVFLERLNRLGPAPSDAPKSASGVRRTALRAEAPPVPRTKWGLWVGAAAAAVIVAAAALMLGSMPEWLTDLPAAPERVLAVPPDPLPVARSSESVMARARSLYAGGHLRDVLRTLDAVGLADPLRPEADRLRAEVQRQVLDAARAARTPAPPARPPGEPQP